jgi:ferredoxin-nitrite reductase
LIEKFDAKLKQGVVIEQPQTEEEAPKVEPEEPASSTAIKMFFANSWKEVPCSEQEYILDAAEKVEIEIENSCRAGTCGTCTAKVLKGEVTYEEDYEALGDLQPGEVLTCCAKPVSLIVIDA